MMGDALRKALLKSEQKPDEIHEAIRRYVPVWIW